MTHVIPYLGQNYSGATIQNLLWQDGSVYLMDNHRAALWCWQQHVDLSSDPHSLLHIDRHYDTLQCELVKHVSAMPNLRGLSIHDYLRAEVTLGEKVPLFRWDNYLSLYLEAINPKLQWFRCLTQKDGDLPPWAGLMESDADELPENFEYWLKDGRWIINIDLDYFFCPGSGDDEFVLMYSEAYLDQVFNGLRLANDRGNIAVITICLTPSNFTPGWAACIELSERIFKALGLAHPPL